VGLRGQGYTVKTSVFRAEVMYMVVATTPSWLELIERISIEVIAPAAAEIDSSGAFPRAALTAMGQSGLLGLISGKVIGGLGEGHRAAVQVVERIARECGTTAMVVCMHYCGAAVIEAFGSREVRAAVARGQHITTLAFSESGSRSQFWAPLSTAVSADNGVCLVEQAVGGRWREYDLAGAGKRCGIEYQRAF
jgi:alkylation response protein AidB-like acyl-CoA dehydrogenase